MSLFQINDVTISGNLVADPELRTTPKGKSVCQLRIAWNESYKDEDGEWQKRGHFFDAVVWDALGETVARDLVKGDALVIHGELRQRTWENNEGQKRSAVEIRANNVFYTKPA